MVGIRTVKNKSGAASVQVVDYKQDLHGTFLLLPSLRAKRSEAKQSHRNGFVKMDSRVPSDSEGPRNDELCKSCDLWKPH